LADAVRVSVCPTSIVDAGADKLTATAAETRVAAKAKVKSRAIHLDINITAR
jgi:hypothetical protein